MIKEYIKMEAEKTLKRVSEKERDKVTQLWVLEFMSPSQGRITDGFTEQKEALDELSYRYEQCYMDDEGPPHLYTTKKEKDGTWLWEDISR
tara:strand:+ start:2482 stop:2754 length:273 start_codon:yes stop_codon:yes gene_type:complete